MRRHDASSVVRLVVARRQQESSKVLAILRWLDY